MDLLFFIWRYFDFCAVLHSFMGFRYLLPFDQMFGKLLKWNFFISRLALSAQPGVFDVGGFVVCGADVVFSPVAFVDKETPELQKNKQQKSVSCSCGGKFLRDWWIIIQNPIKNVLFLNESLL